MVFLGCSSVNEDRDVAAAELDRLALLGKIHWRDCGSYPPELRVCPPHLIVKEDKVRVVHDWSNYQYPLNSVLANGAMGEFLELLSPGAFIGGIDLQDCFLRCLASPSRRRFLGVRHPVSSTLRVYLFIPLGLVPPPGWNDFFVRAVLNSAQLKFSSLRALDIVGDLRLLDANGEHYMLAANMTRFMSYLNDIGVGYHEKDGKRWWPIRSIPRLGHAVDANEGEVEM